MAEQTLLRDGGGVIAGGRPGATMRGPTSQRELAGTSFSFRLPMDSSLLPSITRTAFSMILPSAGLITVPPTRDIFSA